MEIPIDTEIRKLKMLESGNLLSKQRLIIMFNLKSKKHSEMYPPTSEWLF